MKFKGLYRRLNVLFLEGEKIAKESVGRFTDHLTTDDLHQQMAKDYFLPVISAVLFFTARFSKDSSYCGFSEIFVEKKWSKKNPREA